MAAAATNSLVRWGIMGTAGIAKKNAISIIEASNSRLAAVASRDKQRAQQWVDQNVKPFCQDPVISLGSYEELVASNQIDAVYVPLPTALRKEWVLRLANAGKHVLCEKPFGVTAADCQEMVDACAKNDVLLMDGVMFHHHPRMDSMRAALARDLNWCSDTGTHIVRQPIGEITTGSAPLDMAAVPKTLRVTSSFSFPGNLSPGFFEDNIRCNKDTEPMGCMGTHGMYCVRFSMWVMGMRCPSRVRCDIHQQTDEGVPLDASVTMVWRDEISQRETSTASFDTSSLLSLRQSAEIATPYGVLTLDDFVIPQKLESSELQTSVMRLTERALCFRKHPIQDVAVGPCAQHTRMVEEFARLTREKDGAEYKKWAKIAFDTQKVLDAIMDSGRRQGAWTEVA